MRSQAGPSFIYIGTARAGSSWFFEILREHPEVCTPANKGTFYFSRHHEMTREWYEGFFASGPRHRIAGEVCEEYLSSPDALRRLHEYDPDALLICCLRNPYERALSAWRFAGRNGLEAPTLAEEGRRRPEIFEQGNYATQLSFLRSLFPEKQVLIFFFEQLTSAPQMVVRTLYSFLGVDPDFIPPSLHHRVNEAARPRSRLVARVWHDLHMQAWKRSRLLSNTVGLVKRVRPVRRLVKKALYDRSIQSLDWRDHIADFPAAVAMRYETEITALENAFAVNLSHWRASEELKLLNAGPIATGATRVRTSPRL